MTQAINFRDVSFSYDKDAFAIQKLNFSVAKGEFVAVLGHNGSGKSTMARLCNGLLTATSGSVEVFGEPVSENNLYEVRKRVGVVFQNPDNQNVASIVEDDVAFGAENIGLPREEIGRRIEFALRAVGMEEYRHATVARLSGGQKQRVAIAGVLALRPDVMVLDESTAMLDPRGRREIVEVVKRLNREEGLTVLFITHFMEEALLADRAVVMNRGEIVLTGAPEEIFERHEELITFNLALPRIGQICKELRAGGLRVPDTLDPEVLAEALSHCLTENGGTVSEANEKLSDEKSVIAEHLTYVYNPRSPFEKRALDDVSLQIGEGEFFGVIGHTGSGKSTFIRHLNGLIRLPVQKKKKKEGAPVLVVGGADLTDKKTDFVQLRKRVGMVFQYPEAQLFAETVFDDVAFGLKNFAPKGKKRTKEELTPEVRGAIEAVGLDFDEVKDKSPFDLSGGQKRRVAIAGVIVTRPEILVLDEPAAGLDPLGKREIMELLHALHRDWCKTVIIVSHDMDEIAENCTRAAVFSEGKVLCVLPPRELFRRGDLAEAGLDLPLTAKICRALEARGITLGCDYTVGGFVRAALGRKKA